MKLISNELQSLLKQPTINTRVNVNQIGVGYIGNIDKTNQKNLLIAYLKRRAWAIIITVVVIILLLTSSIFTDFGFNIGDYILSWFN